MADVATNAKIWLDGYDLSGDLNAVAITTQVPELNATVFGSEAQVFEPGLPATRAEWAGLWTAGTNLLDPLLRNRLGVGGGILAVSLESGAAGESAHFLRATQARYNPQVEVGALKRFDGSLFATDAYGGVLGTILHNAAVSSDGDGTAYEVGAVASGQYLYACLQVLAISGTLDVTVESDIVGFGTPTTQITFAQASAVGAQYATRVAGPITDTYWRVSYTRSSTATFMVVIGIR